MLIKRTKLQEDKYEYDAYEFGEENEYDEMAVSLRGAAKAVVAVNKLKKMKKTFRAAIILKKLKRKKTKRKVMTKALREKILALGKTKVVSEYVNKLKF